MRPGILLLCSAFALSAHAQNSSRLFYVTDQQKGGANWSVIRTISEGIAESMVMNGFTAKGEVMDAALQRKKSDYTPGSNSADMSMFSGVAALAYDQQHNRLYYATMFTQQLRYINLNEAESGRYFQAADLSAFGRTVAMPVVNQEQQAPIFTRMTIGADGNGYALSNDGNTFLRFSLNKKTTVENLGSLVDDDNNGSISVHNGCSSWGGDMVAAENGDLYLFTMRQNVFKINPATKVATYLGRIKGLNDNFTINGAAVDADGSVLLSTATYAGSRGRIASMNVLEATEEKSETYYNASDLATSNLLFAKPAAARVLNTARDNSAGISIYPNPAVNGFALLKFEDKIQGKITIDVLSASGSMMQRKPVYVNSEGQLVRLSTSGMAKGLYVVRVTDASKKEIYNSKLVVQ